MSSSPSYVDVLFYLSSIGLLVIFMTNQGPTCVSLLSSGLQEEPFRSESMDSFVARNKSYTPPAVSTNSSSGNTSAIIDLGKVRCSMGLIQWYEGLIMFLGYATYIIFMVFNRRILGMCGPPIGDDDDNDGGGGTEKGIALSAVSPGSPADDTSIHVESPLSKSGRALQQQGGDAGDGDTKGGWFVKKGGTVRGPVAATEVADMPPATLLCHGKSQLFLPRGHGAFPATWLAQAAQMKGSSGALHEAFVKYDVDQSYSISYDELKDLLVDLQFPLKLTQDTFAEADADGSGVLE